MIKLGALVATVLLVAGCGATSAVTEASDLLRSCGDAGTPVAYFTTWRTVDADTFGEVRGLLPSGEVRTVSTERVSSGARPTADGRLVTVLRGETHHVADAAPVPHELWLVEPRTGAQRRLYEGPGVSSADPAPDGSRVAFVASEGRAVPYRSRIMVLAPEHPAEVGRLTREPASELVEERLPRWSPDGLRVAYLRSRWEGSMTLRDEVVVVDVATRASLTLPSGAWDHVIALEWSRTGRDLLVSGPAAGPAAPFVTFRVAADGSSDPAPTRIPRSSVSLARDDSLFARTSSQEEGASQDTPGTLNVFSAGGERKGRIALGVRNADELAVPDCALAP